MSPNKRRSFPCVPTRTGGDERDRTDDPLLAKQVLSQLSYTPISLRVRSTLRFPEPQKLNNDFRPELRLTLDVKHIPVFVLHRKEVIQPHLPIRLPCYDFTLITTPTFGRALLTVRLRTSGIDGSHGVTGGVYKARERIHRGMLIRDY